MRSIHVKAQDGKPVTVNFPDETPEEVIAAALRRDFGIGGGPEPKTPGPRIGVPPPVAMSRPIEEQQYNLYPEQFLRRDAEPSIEMPPDPQSQANWQTVMREGDRAMAQGMYPTMVANVIASAGGMGAAGGAMRAPRLAAPPRYAGEVSVAPMAPVRPVEQPSPEPPAQMPMAPPESPPEPAQAVQAPPELAGRRLAPTDAVNSITEGEAVAKVVAGQGAEVAQHVRQGIEQGKVTRNEAEDSITNDALKIVSQFQAAGGKSPIAEGLAKRTDQGIRDFEQGLEVPNAENVRRDQGPTHRIGEIGQSGEVGSGGDLQHVGQEARQAPDVAEQPGGQAGQAPKAPVGHLRLRKIAGTNRIEAYREPREPATLTEDAPNIVFRARDEYRRGGTEWLAATATPEEIGAARSWLSGQGTVAPEDPTSLFRVLGKATAVGPARSTPTPPTTTEPTSSIPNQTTIAQPEPSLPSAEVAALSAPTQLRKVGGKIKREKAPAKVVIPEADRPLIPDPKELTGLIRPGTPVRAGGEGITSKLRSQAPAWFISNPEGYDYAPGQAVLAKAKAGKPLTEREHSFVSRGIEFYREQAEATPPEKIPAGEIEPGDSWTEKGEKYTATKIDEEGRVVAVDGTTKRLDPFETVEADAGSFGRPETIPVGGAVPAETRIPVDKMLDRQALFAVAKQLDGAEKTWQTSQDPGMPIGGQAENLARMPEWFRLGAFSPETGSPSPQEVYASAKRALEGKELLSSEDALLRRLTSAYKWGLEQEPTRQKTLAEMRAEVEMEEARAKGGGMQQTIFGGEESTAAPKRQGVQNTPLFGGKVQSSPVIAIERGRLIRAKQIEIEKPKKKR